MLGDKDAVVWIAVVVFFGWWVVDGRISGWVVSWVRVVFFKRKVNHPCSRLATQEEEVETTKRNHGDSFPHTDIKYIL